MSLNGTAQMYGRMLIALERLEGCTEFASLIPEVRTNLVYTKPNPQGPEDVLGVEGRVTSVGGRPHAAGRPRFGASSHMARLIIELNRRDPSIRAGINFAGDAAFVRWLEGYCRARGWPFAIVDRSGEPAELQTEEGASMPWKVSEAIRVAGGVPPKVLHETSAPGKEPLTVLVGEDPVTVVEEVCWIARQYQATRRPVEKVGKIDSDAFARVIAHRLGKKDETILVPPRPGVDAGVVDLGDGRVLVVAEDPIFTIPGLPLEVFGQYAVHIGASDVAVMGVKPRYMTYSLLLPPKTSDQDLEAIVASIHRTAEELDIAIVGGHTGYYPAVVSPIIGGITVMAVTRREEYVTPAGARPGDDVILTKGPAIETAGILAVQYERLLKERYPSALVERAKGLCTQMTVVLDALTAMETGGVTAMHDATEGGVLGGLFEIAEASAVGMEVEEARISLFAPLA